ncbi:MAG: ATP-dependent helicase [Treponema sp.]|jgi:DNA helicase-2/ATP-dependent DNA helicase PcrA|nr:ATP-dependent helicase [Treponema sp.]
MTPDTFPGPAWGPEDLPPYLEALNPEQRAAVLHTGCPLLILAGAGSGKTRVITTKIAYLIRERGVDPRSILAVTFTNRAAREMADRARLIDGRAGDAMLRTFHSFGAWFLRRNGSLGGLNSNFVIYDEDDAVSLLASVMEDAPRIEVKHTAYAIARAKDYFLTPQDPELDLIDYRPEFRENYAAYEERLARIGNVDFGDLIKKPVEILRSHPEVARRFRDRFRVIMVDEYQDSNVAQFELLKELCGPETYVCVVGDDDQSIYRFRGAEVRNILEFPDRFPGTDIVRLERNYRSTAPILAVASSVVDCNRDRLGKTLRSERGTGKTPTLAFLPDQDAEVSFCAELIANSRKTGNKAAYSDWAILYRTNAQSLGFETELLRCRIPYRVVGSLKFYEREEVKDALALLSFLVNPRDEVNFRRVVNKPARGVGPATVDRITGEASLTGGDLVAAARRVMPALSAKARSGLDAFLSAAAAGASVLLPDEALDAAAAPSAGEDAGPSKKNAVRRVSFRSPEDLSSGEGLSVCVVRLIREAGIAEYHLSHDEIAGNQRIANLQELANAASLYPATRQGLLEFLEHIELDRSMENSSEDGSDDVVTLITLHNTKGLEFRRVIMTGVEQGVFPRSDKQDDDLEEERRLFYVGVTRAMDEIYLTSCAERRMFGRTAPMEPSIFLREAGPSSLRVVGRAPYGFLPSKSPSASGAGRQERGFAKTSRTSSDGRWRIGERVFHDDRGYGEVTEIRESEDGPVIRVRFETGNEIRFLSASQSSRFIKIKDD